MTFNGGSNHIGGAPGQTALLLIRQNCNSHPLEWEIMYRLTEVSLVQNVGKKGRNKTLDLKVIIAFAVLNVT